LRDNKEPNMIVDRIAAKKPIAVTLALALGLALPSGALAQVVEARVAPVSIGAAAAGANFPGMQTTTLSIPNFSLTAAPALAPSGLQAAPQLAAPAASRIALTAASPAVTAALQTAVPAGFTLAEPAPSAAAAAPASVDAHPVIALINQLQAAGVSLPDAFGTRADADKLDAAARALPEHSAMRAQLTQIAAQIRASGGGDAMGRTFDGAGSGDASDAAAPAPGAGRELTAAQIRYSPAAATLPESTRAMPPAPQRLVGQDDAMEAIRFALEMPGDQYNLYVAGPEGSGRETAIRRILGEIAPTQPTPGDLVAVTNFKDTEKPVILELAPGTGKAFEKGVEQFVEQMQDGLVRELNEGETSQQMQQVAAQLQKMQEKAQAAFDAKVAEIKLVGGKFGVVMKTQPTEDGNTHIALLISFNGKTMTEDEVKANIASGAFTQQEWDQAREELKQKKGGIFEGFQAMAQGLGEQAKKIQGVMKQLQEQAAVVAANEAANELVMKVVAPKSTPQTEAIQKRIEDRQQEIQEAFQKALKQKYGKFSVGMTQQGGVLLVIDGKPAIGPAVAEMIAAGKFTQAEYDQATSDFQRKIGAIQQKAAQYQAQDERDLAQLQALTPAPTAGEQKVIEYIKEMAQYAVDHSEVFLSAVMAEGKQLPPGMKAVDPEDYFRVSVLTDNGSTRGAPVIFEENPTFERLFGTAEDNARNMMIPGVGIMKSDSQGGPTMKGGSYHKANGGYLVVNALSVLRNPGAWEALMQAVATGKAEIEEGGLIGLLSRKGDAYPVPTKVKVVLVGSPMIQMLLAQHDGDFAKNFNAVAQFQSTIEITAAATEGFLNFLQHAVATSDGKVMHMTRDAIARVLEQAARMADSNQKFTAQFGALHGLLQEATYWAKRAGQTEIRAVDVEKALTAKRDREETYAKRYMEFYQKNIFRVETSGSAVGQINGLAVMGSFGVPMRITFVVGIGQPGLYSNDKASGPNVTGPSFNKALENEWGFIINEFGEGGKKPVRVQIRASHEQNYGGIDGDSATSTTIYGMLSALSGIPIKQSFAVTGSADQFGNVQAIGGVNEKIEGFFMICKSRPGGLTGEQGIVIPKSNVADLQLSPEVAAAVAAGQFHIYAVDHVSQGIEILTGRPYAEIKAAAAAHIDQVNETLQNMSGGGDHGNGGVRGATPQG
jgi:predicted ATP-dependent protease